MLHSKSKKRWNVAASGSHHDKPLLRRLQFHLKQNQKAIIFVFLVISLNVFITSSYCSSSSSISSAPIARADESEAEVVLAQKESVALQSRAPEPMPSIVRSDVEEVEIHELKALDMEMGGGFLQRVDPVKNKPALWREHSEDGVARFTFSERQWDEDMLIVFDKARNMYIRVKWHQHTFQHAIVPTVEFRIGEEGKWSMLDRICNTGKRKFAGRKMALCSRANHELDELNKEYVKRNPIPIHYVVSVTGTQYFEWQSRVSYYWFKKTQPETSNFTRLLAADRIDHVAAEVPTFLAEHWNLSADGYLAYNKPFSVMQWVLAGNPVNEDIVGIFDVDICMLEDFSHFAVGITPGNPLSQTGFMWFPNDNTSFDQLATQFCHNCSVIDSLAVPIFIHKKDLKEIAVRWLEKTKEIRKVTRHGLKGYQTEKELQLNWTPEMYGYIFGASEMGLKHRTRADMQEYTVGGEGVSERKLKRPSIHFSMHMTLGNGYKWSKGNANATTYLPDAYAKNEVSSRLTKELREALAHLKPLNHSWKTYKQREF